MSPSTKRLWFPLINLNPSRIIRRLTPWLIRRRAIPAQPQRINPPRRIRRVLVLVQPTRQLDRIRRQVPSNLRIIVPMPVVVQTTLGVEVLPLKAQRLVELLAPTKRQTRDFAVGVVFRRPDNLATKIGQFLRCAKVVELVVKRAGFAWAFAVEHGQRAEAAGFVDVAAVVFAAAFGDEVVALPEEFGGVAVDGFGDAAAEGVVAVAGGATVRGGDADQAVLAVVAVFRDEFLPGAATFADQVAEGVVVVMSIALYQQAITQHLRNAGTILHQQIAGRVVGEAFR